MKKGIKKAWDWFKRQSLTKKILLVTAYMVFSVIVLLAIPVEPSEKNETEVTQTEDQQVEAESSSDEEDPADEDIKEESEQEEDDKFDLSTVDYTVEPLEDVSLGVVKRATQAIVIRNNPATEEQMKAVAEDQVSKLSSDISAFSLLFYFEEGQLGGAVTLGTIDYAPNGNWGDAGEDGEKEYKYNFYDIVGEKRSEGPTALEREINTAMRDLWYEKNEQTSDLVSDEEIARILAPEYNKTAEEMLEIRLRVSNYDLGQ